MNRNEILERQKELASEMEELSNVLRLQEDTPEWREEAKARIIDLEGQLVNLENQLELEKQQRELEKQEFHETIIERDQFLQESNNDLNLAKQELTSVQMRVQEQAVALEIEREKVSNLESQLNIVRSKLLKLEPHVRLLGRDLFSEVKEKVG